MKKDDGGTPAILPIIIILVFTVLSLIFPEPFHNFFNNFLN